MTICGDFHDSPSMFRYVNKQTKLTKFLKVQNSVKKNIWNYSFDVYCSRRVPGRITTSFSWRKQFVLLFILILKNVEKYWKFVLLSIFLIFLNPPETCHMSFFWAFPPQNWYSDKWTTCFLRNYNSWPLVNLSIPNWCSGRNSLLRILSS